MRTFFQDFTKDDGTPITVEYSVAGSWSPTTYSPMSGACGGDAPEIEILSSWPNTPEYDGLVWETTERSVSSRERHSELFAAIERLDATAVLTDAERERMEEWLYENHVDEPYEPDIQF